MSRDTFDVSIACSCGSKEFLIPESPHADTVITCNACGAKGKYGEVMAEGAKQTTAAIQQSLKGLFKNK